jgi:hypothetical protein
MIPLDHAARQNTYIWDLDPKYLGNITFGYWCSRTSCGPYHWYILTSVPCYLIYALICTLCQLCHFLPQLGIKYHTRSTSVLFLLRTYHGAVGIKFYIPRWPEEKRPCTELWYKRFPVQIPPFFVPKKCQKVAIVRRTIVKGSTCGEEKRFFSLLANASSARTPARDQLIDQLIVLVLGSRRGCYCKQ